MIHTIEGEDYTDFIKGKNIASNLRLFDDLGIFLNQKNKPGALVALDFSKAFDTLSKKEKIHRRSTGHL